MKREEISASDLHGALSSLLFAVEQEMTGLACAVRISYTRDIYLQVHVETTGRNMQAVVDRLVHGVLWGPFDYRFKCVSRPFAEHVEPNEMVGVSAMVDLAASKPPSGPIDHNNTPEQQRAAAERYGWGWR